ncbi:hypothetical protein Ddc_15015 [Ditylenchus destructor]|nr:hypothetical protein Ddc_15015 [Ditylenchus destructor]
MEALKKARLPSRGTAAPTLNTPTQLIDIIRRRFFAIAFSFLVLIRSFSHFRIGRGASSEGDSESLKRKFSHPYSRSPFNNLLFPFREAKNKKTMDVIQEERFVILLLLTSHTHTHSKLLFEAIHSEFFHAKFPGIFALGCGLEG